MAKAKKSKTKKSKAKKTKKTKRRVAASARGKTRKSKTKKAKKAVRKAAKPKAKAARKTAPKKKKQIIAKATNREGDYEGSRRFLKDESEFVKRHSAEIPAMGKEAEAALDGPEGGALRAAEEEAKSHAKTAGE